MTLPYSYEYSTTSARTHKVDDCAAIVLRGQVSDGCQLHVICLSTRAVMDVEVDIQARLPSDVGQTN